MKKTIYLFAMICFILPQIQTAKKPDSGADPKPVAFVVEAGHYAWAWADARYYACFAVPEKEVY
ncbi:MAG: hypothetical protein ACK5L0_04035 [Candidatus Fimivivens sp.]